MTTRHDAHGWAAAAVMMTVAAAPAPAAISNEDLAKLAQNPVARMISLPFQNNTNLHYGPQAGTQNILTSSPILTVDWTAASGQRWVLPVGGGIGKIFHLGKQPINVQVSAYYNVVTPDSGADWQIRAQVQLLFPE